MYTYNYMYMHIPTAVSYTDHNLQINAKI